MAGAAEGLYRRQPGPGGYIPEGEYPRRSVYHPGGHFFAWVELGDVLPRVEDLPDFFANKAGVLLEGGNGLFAGNAKGYIRLNLAMPRATVQTGPERIAAAIHAQQAEA